MGNTSIGGREEGGFKVFNLNLLVKKSLIVRVRREERRGGEAEAAPEILGRDQTCLSEK